MSSATIVAILTFAGLVFKTVLDLIKDDKNRKFQKEQTEQAAAIKKDISDKAIEQNEKMERKFDIVVEKQQTLEIEFSKLDIKFDTEFNKVNEKLDNHIVNTEVKESFVLGIYKATEGEAMKVIQNNFTIDTEVKSMIMKWGSLMHKLGVMFHDSETRKLNKFKRSELLTDQQNLIIASFNEFIDSKIKGKKTNSKRQLIKFSDLLIEKRVYASFESLILELEINGLDDKNFIEKFEFQVIKFCKNLLTAVEVWDTFESKVIFDREDAA